MYLVEKACGITGISFLAIFFLRFIILGMAFYAVKNYGQVTAKQIAATNLGQTIASWDVEFPVVMHCIVGDEGKDNIENAVFTYGGTTAAFWHDSWIKHGRRVRSTSAHNFICT